MTSLFPFLAPFLLFQLVDKQAKELKDLKLRLVEAEAEAMESKQELDETVTLATAKLEKAQIDLVRTVTLNV